MKKILITGASGFVGSNLARYFLGLGYSVHILTRAESKLWRLDDIYKDLNDHKVNLVDKENLSQVVKTILPNFIIHNAIYGGRPSQADEQKIFDVNFQGTKNLLDSCADIDFECFINTGSSSEYGTKLYPMKETDICEPMNVYGIAKLSATLYCNYVAKKSGKNIGTLRLFSPFGDYEDQGRLFTDLAYNCSQDKKVMLANKNAVRDFVYIGDVLSLYNMVLNSPAKLKGEIFNVAYGEQHSVEYMAEKVRELMNSKSDLSYDAISGRNSDTNVWKADITKVKDVFDWSPDKDFDLSVKQACSWFIENRNLYGLKK